MKFFYILLSLFLIPGSAVFAWNGILLISSSDALWMPLAIGILGGFFLTLLIIRYAHIICVFDHELAHALMALLFFRRIRRFIVTAHNGGYVLYSGGFGGEFGNKMITIAPYFLPTFTIIAVLFIPLVPQQYKTYYYIFIGFTVIYHLLSTISEIRRNWTSSSFTDVQGERAITDILRFGFVPAFFSIIGLTLFIFGVIFYQIWGGFPGAWTFIKSSCLYSWDLYSEWGIKLFDYFRSLVSRWL